MSEKRIGKIQRITVGFGGYQDEQLGVSVTLGSDKDSWGVGDFRGTWGPRIKHTEHCKWTEAERQSQYADTMEFLGSLLVAAKKEHAAQLVGVPVEVEFSGMALVGWRVLEEAI